MALLLSSQIILNYINIMFNSYWFVELGYGFMEDLGTKIDLELSCQGLEGH